MLSTRALVLLATALCASFSSAAPAPPQVSAQGSPPPGVPTGAPTEVPIGGHPHGPPSSIGATSPSGAPVPPVPQTSGVSTSPIPQTSAAASAPAPQVSGGQTGAASGYWLADIDHSKDTVWQGQSGYKVFRNVVSDYGAKGDGVTDDTAAINKAMSDGNRCGGSPNFPDCDSSTITPAILYFPPGTYLVSKPIQMFYYTQMIGDPNNLPTLLASSNFVGMAVVDSDPYVDGGANWYTNQNNFFRQVRNFIIDIRQWGGGSAGAGIHWQVAQATSLQNIVFELSQSADTQQVGVFMDNGSGGFFADLTVNGGFQGMFLGSQQFTSRNLTFNNCQTSIYMNWNWGWTLHGITVNGGTTALNMSAYSQTPGNQSVGSVVLADSVISNVQYGVIFAYRNSDANMYPTGGTLIMDNVDMTGVTKAAVADTSLTTVLAPGKITAWASGLGYNPSAQGTDTVLKGQRQENAIRPAHKVPSLLDSAGNVFGQTRPQYEGSSGTDFLTAKSNGCKGDGQTDDSTAINALLKQAVASQKMVYFEHGAYLVKDTIMVPPGVTMVGEIWSLIVADSASFDDPSKPKAVVQVGQPNQQGNVQMSDLIFETNGPAAGAVMIEWNLRSTQGGSGMWDCHVRIGGSAGTNLEYAECPAVNGTNYTPDKNCLGVFLMFHATKSAGGVYLENTWFWVADHALDADSPKQITIYSGRGVLIEAQGAVWLWGTASEHSILYNYQFNGAQAVFSGLMQSETPYFQPYPLAPAPLSLNSVYDDPTFALCQNSNSQYCKESWGLRIYNSRNILIYSTGLYSFFQNYQQTCLGPNNCQENMIHIQNSQVNMYAVNTFAAVNMIIDDDVGTVKNDDNKNWWCATLAYYFTVH